MTYLDDERRWRTEQELAKSKPPMSEAAKAVQKLIDLGWSHENFSDIAYAIKKGFIGRTPLRKIITKSEQRR
jgi:hypothetical protein